MLTLIYVISMEFMSLRHRRRSSWRNVPSGEGHVETESCFQAPAAATQVKFIHSLFSRKGSIID